MGEYKVNSKLKKENRLLYINHLLDDLKSLAYMLENNRIESDVIRLGAEQEFCLVDQSWRPAPKAAAILKSLKDKHFTTELAKYNVEINLDPFEVKTSVFCSCGTLVSK